MRAPVLVPVVVLAALAGCGAVEPADSAVRATGAADCELALTFDERDYLGVSFPEQVPAGASVGLGSQRQCWDVDPVPGRSPGADAVRVFEVPGVPAEVALAAGWVLYVRVDGSDPDGMRAVQRAEEIVVAARRAAGTDAADCVQATTARTLAARAFAFDGTVLAVEPAAESDPSDPDAQPTYPVAEFEVHVWFAGGAASTVSVSMQREVLPGQRLLVSGQPLFGVEPLDDPIAWECGFTVERTPAEAARWRKAFG